MAPPRPAIPHSDAVRAGLLIAGCAGVAALVAATFTTVIRITVGATTRLAALDTNLSGWDRHGPALLVIAAFALVMLAGAVRRGARPAVVAVIVCGAAALLVALAFDAPRLDDTGQVGRLYADASAGPGVGFWLELAGGALLVGAGGGLLWLASAARRSDAVGGASRRRTARRRGGAAGAGAATRDA